MFRNKKKMILSIILGIFMIFGSVACSNQSTSENTNSDNGSSGGNSEQNSETKENAKEKTKVVFWHNWETGPAGESLKKSVELFNSTHPDIVVEPVYVAPDGGDSVSSKLLTSVAAGNPPDVMLASRYGIAEYMDALTPLDDLAARDGITEDMYYEWAWGEATYEGTLLGLPYDATSRALFYNKDHFKAAGLDPENPPTTIEELEEVARKLTIKDANRYNQIGFIPWYGQGWLYTWGWSFGGKFVDENGIVTANDPKIVEALEWETEFAKEYGIESLTSFVSSAGSNATDPFLTGQLSMMVNGNWMLGQIEEYAPDLNYGISYIPTPTGDNFTTFLGGRVLLMPKGVKNQDAAWEFIKFMCATEEGQSFKEIPGDFAAMPIVNEKIYGDDPRQEKFLEVLPNGKYRPVILAGNMMWDELAKAPDLVMHGQGTAKEVLDRITDKINKEVESKKAELK